MPACKLKKGDRIYECRYHESTLTELITDPELLVQGEDSHYWHWKAKIIETNSHNVVPGEIVEFGLTEEAPAYGPHLFRKDVYKYGYDAAEPVLPPFDTEGDRTPCIKNCHINDDVEILGHVFHGLADIKDHVEMSLYKDYSRGMAKSRETNKACEIHVGEMWMPYPCFDSSDYAYEDRTYQNYIFRRNPITQEDMRKLSELRSHGDERRVSDDVPLEMLPMVYYCGDDDTMLVAT